MPKDTGDKPSHDSDATIDQSQAADASRTIGLQPGDAIGNFKILSRLGEGGFGVVYLADQTSPVKRRVAMKIIKPGMDTRAVIARFEAERQALALMNHPGIARVYEASTTVDHRPYFVMEYVQGESITEYCDRHRLSTEARLELFAAVCDAVQHAHMKGVIHRDLKPSNILVIINEREEPQAKIIDFGIAKATSHSLTENTIFTQQGQLIGTPEYMSPEQAEMSAVDIDTRSDVYSLGVVLYELLIGCTPFDSRKLREAGLSGIQDMIRNQPAPHPSTKLTSLDATSASEIAKMRATSLDHLRGTLRKELEWIPLKALRKERSERYASAKEMGDDVRRYLDGEALEAGPESTSYRVRKLLKRNKGPVVAAAIVLIVLVLGIVTTSIFAVRAAANAREADHQATLARNSAKEAEIQGKTITTQYDELRSVAKSLEEQRELAEAKSVEAEHAARLAMQEAERATEESRRTKLLFNYLNNRLFSAIDPRLQGAGPDQFRAQRPFIEVLDQAMEHIDTDFVDEPELEAEIRTTMGRAYFSLARYEGAAKQMARAVALREQLSGPDDPKTLSVRAALAQAKAELGEIAVAETILREVLKKQSEINGPDDIETMMTANGLASLLHDQGQIEEAESIYRSLLANPQARRDHPETRRPARSAPPVDDLLSQQVSQLVVGNRPNTKPDTKEATEQEQVTNQMLRPSVRSMVGVNLAILLRQRGELDEALELAQQAWDDARRLGMTEHALVAANEVGIIHFNKGNLTEARDILEPTLQAQRVRLGANHPQSINLLNTLGAVHVNLGDTQTATEYLEEASGLIDQTYGPQSQAALDNANNRATLYYNLGQVEEATAMFERAVKVSETLKGKSAHDTYFVKLNWAVCLDTIERDDLAEHVLKELVNDTTRDLGPNDPLTLRSTRSLADLFEEHRRFDEAEPLMRSVLDAQQSQNANDIETLITMQALARLLRESGRYQESIALYEPALAGLDQDEYRPIAAIVRGAYGRCLFLDGQVDKAGPVLEQAFKEVQMFHGPESPRTQDIASYIRDLSAAHREAGQDDQAQSYEALLIDHQPDTSKPTNNDEPD